MPLDCVGYQGRRDILGRLPVPLIHPQERVRQLKPTAQRSRDMGFGVTVRFVKNWGIPQITSNYGMSQSFYAIVSNFSNRD